MISLRNKSHLSTSVHIPVILIFLIGVEVTLSLEKVGFGEICKAKGDTKYLRNLPPKIIVGKGNDLEIGTHQTRRFVHSVEQKETNWDGRRETKWLIDSKDLQNKHKITLIGINYPRENPGRGLNSFRKQLRKKLRNKRNTLNEGKALLRESLTTNLQFPNWVKGKKEIVTFSTLVPPQSTGNGAIEEIPIDPHQNQTPIPDVNFLVSTSKLTISLDSAEEGKSSADELVILLNNKYGLDKMSSYYNSLAVNVSFEGAQKSTEIYPTSRKSVIQSQEEISTLDERFNVNTSSVATEVDSISSNLGSTDNNLHSSLSTLSPNKEESKSNVSQFFLGEIVEKMKSVNSVSTSYLMTKLMSSGSESSTLTASQIFSSEVASSTPSNEGATRNINDTTLTKKKGKSLLKPISRFSSTNAIPTSIEIESFSKSTTISILSTGPLSIEVFTEFGNKETTTPRVPFLATQMKEETFSTSEKSIMDSPTESSEGIDTTEFFKNVNFQVTGNLDDLQKATTFPSALTSSDNSYGSSLSHETRESSISLPTIPSSTFPQTEENAWNDIVKLSSTFIPPEDITSTGRTTTISNDDTRTTKPFEINDLANGNNDESTEMEKYVTDLSQSELETKSPFPTVPSSENRQTTLSLTSGESTKTLSTFTTISGSAGNPTFIDSKTQLEESTSNKDTSIDLNQFDIPSSTMDTFLSTESIYSIITSQPSLLTSTDKGSKILTEITSIPNQFEGKDTFTVTTDASILPVSDGISSNNLKLLSTESTLSTNPSTFTPINTSKQRASDVTSDMTTRTDGSGVTETINDENSELDTSISTQDSVISFFSMKPETGTRLFDLSSSTPIDINTSEFSTDSWIDLSSVHVTIRPSVIDTLTSTPTATTTTLQQSSKSLTGKPQTSSTSNQYTANEMTSIATELSMNEIVDESSTTSVIESSNFSSTIIPFMLVSSSESPTITTKKSEESQSTNADDDDKVSSSISPISEEAVSNLPLTSTLADILSPASTSIPNQVTLEFTSGTTMRMTEGPIVTESIKVTNTAMDSFDTSGSTPNSIISSSPIMPETTTIQSSSSISNFSTTINDPSSPIMDVTTIPSPTSPISSKLNSTEDNSVEEKLCDDSSWLECDMNASRCICKDGMMYDKENQICVSILDEQCSLKIDPNGKERRCINNAECITKEKDEFGFCKCKNGFIPSVEGFCLSGLEMPCSLTNQSCHPNLECSNATEKCVCKINHTPGKPGSSNQCFLDYNGNCSRDVNLCNSHAFLNCSESTNKCKCQGSQIYDVQKKVCQSTAGTESKCMLKEDSQGRMLGCVDNAKCKINDDRRASDTGVCECNEGFENNWKGFCQEKNSNGIIANLGYYFILKMIILSDLLRRMMTL